jgi:hypothetical protein
METELLLEKLRRLRYQQDYPLRLFLAAMGERPAGLVPTSASEPSMPGSLIRRWTGLRWERSKGGCPCCGYRSRSIRFARSRPS